MLTPPRLTSAEILDDDNAPVAAVHRSLRDLRRFNSIYGGTSAYLRLLRRIAPSRSEPISILDLGTGTSDLLESVRQRWTRACVVGLDRSVRHLAYGAEIGRSAVHRVAGDAFSLPFRDDAVDVVTSSHFFHHFSPDENVNILTESLRIARRCVLVTDTRRHWVPLLFVSLLGALRLVGEITRNDAPASVRQGYTLPEVRIVAERVVARHFALRKAVPYRFGLVVWK